MPPRGDVIRYELPEIDGMTSNTYNPFKTSYPSSRGPLGHIFKPVVDYRTYLRAAHMLLMFPLGVGYFVFLVVTLAVGGSLIWTLIGPVVLLAAMFISRWLGDLEAFTAGFVNNTPIRRPPSRLEGVSNFRSQVKVRLVDPTTWTGLVYLGVQFPVGIAALVGIVVMYAVTGAMVGAPVIAAVTEGPVMDLNGIGITLDTPFEALLLTPFGLAGLVLASHVVLVFSSIHGLWARTMLGSRSTRISHRSATPPTGGGGPGLATTSNPELTSPSPAPAGDLELGSGAVQVAELPDPATASSSPEILTLVTNPSDDTSVLASDSAAINELTAREQEVFMLMAHGDTNADISEELFISEGTVKTHVKRVFAKLELRDRSQLVVFAYERRLVVPASGDGVDEAGRHSANG